MFKVRRYPVILFPDFDNFAIIHAGDAIGVGEDPIVVGDDDDSAVR